MDFKRQAKRNLLSYKKVLDKALKEYFANFVQKTKSPFTNKNIQAVAKAMFSFTLRGGKRIRGALVKYGHDAITNKQRQSVAVLNLAMATEIIHSYLLIADDIMDRAEKRRSAPTVHKVLEKYYSRNYPDIDKEHIGLSLAMMAFTLANHMAFELVLKLRVKKETKLAILKHLHKTVRLTTYGQIMDMATEFESVVTPQEVIDVQRTKTAYYTFRNPIMTGSLLAGASEPQIRALNNYAMNVGIAFQLRDDILGMYGDEKKIGKTVSSDIKEGKKTMLIVKALEFGDEEIRDFIKQKLGRPRLSRRDLEKFRSMVEETGSLDYSQKLIEKYIQKGKKHLIENESLFKKDGYEFLLGIADYIGSREK